jgi:hypothetical protein
VIDPNPQATTSPSAPAAPQAPAVDDAVLTPAELYQLTLYKWRYSLEAYGFETHQVRELMFLKWLHASQRVLP